VIIDYAGSSRFVPAAGAAVELDDPGLPGNRTSCIGWSVVGNWI
jgi:hypothetical protein